MSIKVVVTGDRRRADRLEGLARRLGDQRPQLRSLVGQLAAAEAARFAGMGVNWQPPAKSTLARDRRGGRNPKLLVNSGRLMTSLTTIGDPDMVLQARAHSLRFGTSVFYARFHQRGQGVPRRRVVGVTRTQRQSLVNQLQALLIGDA
jgi:phage gpG-like protein